MKSCPKSRLDTDLELAEEDEGLSLSAKPYASSVWSCRIREHLADGVDVYGYFSKFYSGYPVSDIRTITEKLGKY